jgi:hypothetical protein
MNPSNSGEIFLEKMSQGSGNLPTSAPAGLTVISGPERAGSEQRWRVRLADGRAAVLGRLLPELAADEALRRRYVGDLARIRGLAGLGVAEIVAWGEQAGEPPWRLRLDPPGEALDVWLQRRAPAPPEEVAALGIALAELLGALHQRGVVLRDLTPRVIVRGEDGRLWLTDVGLARVDILSTRTAASLLVEGSPYASPEQLTRTTLDARSDLFVMGAILFQAVTGSLPFGDGPALLRSGAPPRPSSLCGGVPAALEAVILRCLAEAPEQRPAIAGEVAAALRGEVALAGDEAARTVCQACGAAMRVGQRICLACGREAVLFAHTPEAAGGQWCVALTKGSEEAAFTSRLTSALEALSAGPVPAMNLVIGDARMYSKEELKRRYRLPLRLFGGLSAATAEALRGRLAAEDLKVKVVRSDVSPQRRGAKIGLGIVGVLFAAVMVPVAVFSGVAATLIVGAVLVALFGVIAFFSLRAAMKPPPRPILSLRPAPAALPASDPLVARLAAVLRAGAAADVREQVGVLALLVQRLVDHRAAVVHERAELDRVVEPVEPLVALICGLVAQIGEIDAALRDLDEGSIVRALAASEARGEPASAREALLSGLERLRGLEEGRALALHRLLEAGALLRRSVEMGLGVRDAAAEHERDVQLALRALGGAE